eukprot:jgi/Botrbrau1/7918/Bobra.9_2s0086.1
MRRSQAFKRHLPPARIRKPQPMLPHLRAVMLFLLGKRSFLLRPRPRVGGRGRAKVKRPKKKSIKTTSASVARTPDLPLPEPAANLPTPKITSEVPELQPYINQHTIPEQLTMTAISTHRKGSTNVGKAKSATGEDATPRTRSIPRKAAGVAKSRTTARSPQEAAPSGSPRLHPTAIPEAALQGFCSPSPAPHSFRGPAWKGHPA